MEVIGASSPVRTPRWDVVVELPTREAYAPTRTMIMVMGILVAVAAAISIGLAILMSNSISTRLIKLRDAASKLGKGESGSRVGIESRDEVGELADSFNQMADRLQRSERRAQRASLENEVLAEIGRIISSSPEIDEVYRPFVHRIRQLIPSDQIYINLVDWDSGTYKTGYEAGLLAQDSFENGFQRPLEGSLTGLVARSRAPKLIPADDDTGLAAGQPDVEPATEAAFRSMLAVPLVSADTVTGVLILNDRRLGVYNDRHRALAERIADQVAGAISQSQLYSERRQAEEALQKAHDELEIRVGERTAALQDTEERARLVADESDVLVRIGRIVSSSLDVQEVFDQLGEEIKKLIPLDRMVIAPTEPHNFSQNHAMVLGDDEDGLIQEDAVPLAGTHTEEVILRREPVLLQPDDPNEIVSRFPGLAPLIQAGIRSLISAPLVSNNEAVGVLHIRSFQPAAYEHRHLELAGRVADQIAGAMASAQLYAERAEAEDRLRGYADELARSNSELEQFAYVASHDLREPLRMVSSYTQLLGRRYRGRLDSDADEFIEFAVDGANRMQQLIEDLLAYSQVDANAGTLEPIDSNAAFQQAVANCAAVIDEADASVTRDELPTVEADPTQLRQVFQNLIANAIKFRREAQPTVHASARLERQEWVFSVRDNGIGIEAEFAERIFTIFQRLHTREDYSGTGIGLAICKKIVEGHGGRIWVESEPGKGSTFRFTIQAKRG